MKEPKPLHNKKEKKSIKDNIVFIFGILLFALYVFMGLAFIFWDNIPFNIQKEYRIIFGIVLIFYGASRLYRTLYRNKNK